LKVWLIAVLTMRIDLIRVLFKLNDMLEHPKALSTSYFISENLKDNTMDNQQGIF